MSELLDLNWDVFVTPGIPTVTSDLPPGTTQQMWSPIASTLIYGKRDAILVDALITVEQAGTLVDWVAASGKNLTTIDATHGHGDHFFGASTVLQRFPRTRLVATPEGVSELVICYPVWAPERHRTPHVIVSHEDYTSAALPILPRDRYRPPRHDA